MMDPRGVAASLTFGYDGAAVGGSRLVHTDCLEWLPRLPENGLHAVVTDPPYGLREYDRDQLGKRALGRGGVWRVPPSFDGHRRAPLPRFTALGAAERRRLRRFFRKWAGLLLPALWPGAHAFFIAADSFLAPLVYGAWPPAAWSSAAS
jgi:site-specific DNA-methyltransferase (adenine-specific)